MNYIVTDEQLTAIANEIRAKTEVPPSGKNLCNPETLTAKVSTSTTYTVSMKVTWNGTAQVAAAVTMSYSGGGGQPGVIPVRSTELHEAGAVTREYITATTSASYDTIDIRASTGITIEDVQVEAGNVMTDYEPYQTLIEFPDGFINALRGINS